ncbi:beta-1,6-N-acetylglucosaminyltransferase [Akkermansiaceae bacterium]|nr:beta-1,6-N-acetylglucosaminyltransferase [Akkermansiaceae bacterium]
MKEEDNTHFILLSESCLPIQPLARILLRLQHDGRSRFSFKSWTEPSELRRHRARSTPEVPEGCWRFHPQWWLLDRTATRVVTRNDNTSQFENFFASDEAYFGSTLMREGYPVDDLVDSRDLTWTHWERETGSPNEYSELPPEKLRDIINSDCFFARKFPAGADIGIYRLHD